MDQDTIDFQAALATSLSGVDPLAPDVVAKVAACLRRMMDALEDEGFLLPKPEVEIEGTMVRFSIPLSFVPFPVDIKQDKEDDNV